MPVEYEPTSENIVCHYADGVRLVLDFLKKPFGDRSPHYITRLGTCPVRFVGEEGWVETGDSGQIKGEPKSLLNSHQIELPRERGLEVALHSRDFFDNIHDRGASCANAEVMRRSHIACHTAAIAWILGRKLRMNPVSESFIDDSEANLFRFRPSRKWAL